MKTTLKMSLTLLASGLMQIMGLSIVMAQSSLCLLTITTTIPSAVGLDSALAGGDITKSTSQACPGTPTVEDIDGNVYKTVKIGTQCWMQSNLKVSRYNNGDAIYTDLDNDQWRNTEEGAYAIYDDDPANDALYGKLYNHYAVTDDRGLCPTGWHVPTDEEWRILENHLGGSGVAGGKLKSTKKSTPGGWRSPNTGATNSSGFTAPPGGLRYSNGDFYNSSGNGFWWSSSVSSASNAWLRGLAYDGSYVYRDSYSLANGFSVRCCRD